MFTIDPYGTFPSFMADAATYCDNKKRTSSNFIRGCVTLVSKKCAELQIIKYFQTTSYVTFNELLPDLQGRFLLN